MKSIGILLAVMVLAASAGVADTNPPPGAAAEKLPGFALIPSGKFEMGDHFGYRDEKHESHEVPIHTVRLDSFYIGIYDVTTKQYCEFLNSALAQKIIEVRKGGVYLTGGQDLLCDTREMSPYSRMGWDGKAFAVLDKKEDHPMVCVRWHGAASYCNWLSAQKKLPLCYNIATWECDYNKSGFRLPTEAEWEYAARGGRQNPYCNYPWGNDSDPAKANVPQSDNPFRTGPQPWTTPVGFFNGKLQRKADFGWPGSQETYQTANSVNGFGLYDMAGNVWQWCNDWYTHNYYSYSPTDNPVGPAQGSLLPDGKPYHSMRGGCWFNGDYMRSRISNHVPSYYRGPQDPDHPYYAFGFRVVLPVDAESRPVIKPTPVNTSLDRMGRPGGGPGGPGGPGGRPPRDPNRPPRPRDQASPQVGSDPAPSSSTKPAGGFTLRSSEVTDGGTLPKEFTGDGNSSTLPLEWSAPPAGTKSFAVIMHHIDPKGLAKWYWILYNIPPTVQSLPKNVKGVGTLGTNSVNDRTEYAPPHSKGPGPKTYVYTVYALSAGPQPAVAPERVNREVLLAAMKDKILASATLSVTYTRFTVDDGDGPPASQPSSPRRPPPDR